MPWIVEIIAGTNISQYEEIIASTDIIQYDGYTLICVLLIIYQLNEHKFPYHTLVIHTYRHIRKESDNYNFYFTVSYLCSLFIE